MGDLRALVDDDLVLIEKILSKIIICEDSIMQDLSDFINNKNSKKIRPIITLLYLKANNKSISNDIIKLLAASELIHNASLLHDDVIDNAKQRRNNITLHEKHNKTIGVLCGDYLLYYAVKMLFELNNNEIINDFLCASQEMSRAEIKQYLSRGHNISLEDYLLIAKGKTASLFESILKNAARITDLDIELSRNIGTEFGILFQINNDMTQESIDNDKINNLSSIINIIGIENCSDLKDNYKNKLKGLLIKTPENKYKKALEEIIIAL